jgi:hypothetical protein
MLPGRSHFFDYSPELLDAVLSFFWTLITSLFSAYLCYHVTIFYWVLLWVSELLFHKSMKCTFRPNKFVKSPSFSYHAAFKYRDPIRFSNCRQSVCNRYYWEKKKQKLRRKSSTNATQNISDPYLFFL